MFFAFRPGIFEGFFLLSQWTEIFFCNAVSKGEKKKNNLGFFGDYLPEKKGHLKEKKNYLKSQDDTQICHKISQYEKTGKFPWLGLYLACS